jgi:hypothetical protein
MAIDCQSENRVNPSNNLTPLNTVLHKLFFTLKPIFFKAQNSLSASDPGSPIFYQSERASVRNKANRCSLFSLLDIQLLFFVYSSHPKASFYQKSAEIKGLSLEEMGRVTKR